VQPRGKSRESSHCRGIILKKYIIGGKIKLAYFTGKRPIYPIFYGKKYYVLAVDNCRHYSLELLVDNNTKIIMFVIVVY
jgi:hypothetical protein